MKKVVEVVAGIIEYEGNILCMQRNKSICDEVSYKWEFPGGKIEVGESQENAMIRELSEEMCMKVKVIGHFCDVEYEYVDYIVNLHCYKCTTNNSNFVMNVHKDYRWLPLNQLDILDWAPADWPVVKMLMKEKRP